MLPDNRNLHRNIVQRWVITGILTLETPAHFGTGDSDSLTDMTLLLDELDGSPLLPGTSLAGALRNYLREYEGGYERAIPRPWAEEERQALLVERNSLAVDLFGGLRGDPEGSQSPLIVADAYGQSPGEELRDGVDIDPRTRTAKPRKKYDMQLLPAGSKFTLRLELLVSAEDDEDTLAQALALALDGLEKGEIGLGMRKRRGFGRCRASSWSLVRYRLDDVDGLLAWLSEDHPDWYLPRPETRQADSIYELLGADAGNRPDDQRAYAELKARLEIGTSLLIRSGFGESDQAPDVVHLHSPRPETAGSGTASQTGMRPVVPGTSLAGALRARAQRIAQTLAEDAALADNLIESIFGPQEVLPDEPARASRLEVSETEIEGGYPLVQSRIRIDRFTGGAAETALFEEQPIFAGNNGIVKIDLRLRNPSDPEIGLLLLLLKDLWTGDLPVGGETSIGRGRLLGRKATLRIKSGDEWRFAADEVDGSLEVKGDRQKLQAYVDALNEELQA
jgi:CRISPR/Cas system CSM-associated protein Csm3 (group 7 of RAMP superfamily)